MTVSADLFYFAIYSQSICSVSCRSTTNGALRGSRERFMHVYEYSTFNGVDLKRNYPMGFFVIPFVDQSISHNPTLGLC